jgi:hypothetical protein
LRIARVRNLYVALVPELEPYVLVVRGRPAENLLHGERLRPSRWQLTLTTAGMVAVVNSVVIGASAGLVVAALGDASLAVMLAAGAFVAVSALAVHRRHHRRVRDAYELRRSIGSPLSSHLAAYEGVLLTRPPGSSSRPRSNPTSGCPRVGLG